MTRFYEDPDTGIMLPSVTTILGMLPKPFLVNWAAKTVAEKAVNDETWRDAPTKQEQIDFLKAAVRGNKKAADVGTTVHKAVETGDWSEAPARFGKAYDAFCAATPHDVVASEVTVYNTPEFYAGTADGVYVIDGDLTVIDVKTGKAYEEHWLQCEAYGRALPAVTHKALIHLNWDGSWSMEKRPLAVEDMNVFRALVEVFRWSERTKKVW